MEQYHSFKDLRENESVFVRIIENWGGPNMIGVSVAARENELGPTMVAEEVIDPTHIEHLDRCEADGIVLDVVQKLVNGVREIQMREKRS